jgi:hypothetical protein
VSDPLDITQLIAAKVAAVKRTVARSKIVADCAKDDLDEHQRWLRRHRELAAVDLKRHQRRSRRRRAIRACEQAALFLVLLVPSICVAAFRGAIWVLTGLGTLLSTSGSWIGAKSHSLGVWVVHRLSMCCSWTGAKAHGLWVWVADRISLAFGWGGERGRALGGSLGRLMWLGLSWGGVKARAAVLRLKDSVGRAISQAPLRLGGDDDARDRMRDALRARHLHERDPQEAAFVRLRADHERLQNRIHALDKFYGRRGANGGRAGAAPDKDWVQLRELARNARRLFEMQERGLLAPAVPRANGRPGAVKVGVPLAPIQPRKVGQVANEAPDPIAGQRPRGGNELWPARSVG